MDSLRALRETYASSDDSSSSSPSQEGEKEASSSSPCSRSQIQTVGSKRTAPFCSDLPVNKIARSSSSAGCPSPQIQKPGDFHHEDEEEERDPVKDSSDLVGATAAAADAIHARENMDPFSSDFHFHDSDMEQENPRWAVEMDPANDFSDSSDSDSDSEDSDTSDRSDSSGDSDEYPVEDRPAFKIGIRGQNPMDHTKVTKALFKREIGSLRITRHTVPMGLDDVYQGESSMRRWLGHILPKGIGIGDAESQVPHELAELREYIRFGARVKDQLPNEDGRADRFFEIVDTFVKKRMTFAGFYLRVVVCIGWQNNDLQLEFLRLFPINDVLDDGRFGKAAALALGRYFRF